MKKYLKNVLLPVLLVFLCFLPACGNSSRANGTASDTDASAGNATVLKATASEAEAEAASEGDTFATASDGESDNQKALREALESDKQKAARREQQKKDDQKYYEMADKYMTKMTLNQKIGQMFIVRPDALEYIESKGGVNSENSSGVTQFSNSMKMAQLKYPVGGVCFFSKNIVTSEQTEQFIQDLQANTDIPMFISVDEEGGVVARLANSHQFETGDYKDVYAIGETRDKSLAYDYGKDIGTYLKRYGFNVDFAPVGDVFTNPSNAVIGRRAFSDDAHVASDMVEYAIEGFHEAGCIECVKHFPGHGDTYGDTHTSAVYVSKTWEEMKKCELLPFYRAIVTGTDMIMVSHIIVGDVTEGNLPASMSHEIITDKLRNEMGFDGVVITDGMAMGAITDEYTSGSATVQSIQAGSDIILTPMDYAASFDEVRKAVEDGTLTESRINESVRRILFLKFKYGILKSK